MESRPQGYVDKVMDSSVLPALSDDDLAPAGDADGFRSWFAETRVGAGRTDNDLRLRMATEIGQRVGYTHQTLNWGDYVLEADARTTRGDLGIGTGSLGLTTRRTSSRVVARNLGLPVTSSLFADTSVGDVSSEITSALGRTYRLSLGASTVRGASVKLSGEDFDVRAGTGERGQLVGGPVPGFESIGGQSAWLGASRRFGKTGSIGIQVNRSTGLRSAQGAFGSLGGIPDESTSIAAAGTYVWTLKDGEFVRGRAIGISNRAGDELGTTRADAQFLEGTYQGTGQRHEFGAFRSDPGVRFGENLVSTGGRGLYWRVDAYRPRLSWGGGFDYEDQSGQGLLEARRLGTSANVFWRIDRNTHLAAHVNLALSQFRPRGDVAIPGRDTRSANMSVSYRTRFRDWAPTTFRLTLRRNELLVADDVPATGEQFEWEQEWITGRAETQRPEFATSLGIARDRSDAGTEFQPTAGAVFRYWFDPDWHVGGSLRYTARNTNLATSRGLSGTVDTERILAQGWRVGASLQLNQAVVRLPAGATGTLFPGPQTSRTDDKYLSVYVRWEDSVGTTPRGIGSREGSAGAGAIDGVVFFDANRDGVQQADERGVPEVEVFLDGRFRVRTDRDGKFSYPLVGTGVHVLTLVPESVPLPWGVAGESGTRIDVPLRGQASPRIPVVRVSE